MILTVNLNSTVDIAAPVLSIRPGTVSRVKNITSYPGGKATNAARAAAAIGAKVFTTGFCGSREKALMENFLASHRVASAFVAVSGTNRQCILLTETDKSRETVINSESNLRVSVAQSTKLLGIVKKKSAGCSYAVLSGSLPLCLPDNYYAHVIKAINPRCKVVLDTSSKYLKEGIKARPAIIKQNLHELESAFNVKLRSKGAIKKFIMALSNKYCLETVIVTMDHKGSVAYAEGFFYFVPALAAKNIVSPVGSGDAFSAGLVYGLSKGKGLKEGLCWANACARANLFKLGSCFITGKEVKKYLKDVKILSW